MAIQVIILAAGQGKRMHSTQPKVLHQLAGKPLLEHIIQTLLRVSPDMTPIVVYGYQGDQLKEAFSHYQIHWILQKEQLGTAHAVSQALPIIADDDHVLILCGDVPLISVETLNKLINTTPPQSLGMLSATTTNPSGYGRIKRDHQQRIISIVEEKDATNEERAITEINPGIYFVPANLLKKWLPRLKNNNAQNEYYLTDIISLATLEKIPIHSVEVTVFEEILGVNDKKQLAHLERFYQHQSALTLMEQGVTLYDPNRIDIRGEVNIGHDVIIDVNVVLEGKVTIGKGCLIGPNTILRNTHIGDYVEIKANSVIDGADIKAHCIIGPFARIRPGTKLSSHVHIGNFVEIKNSNIADESKINHLSYVGDSDIGKRVNLGAGTITCNYDGANKHKTIIGDDVHIGSDTQLIAPVTIGDFATIGAGSTITKDVPPKQLTLTHKLEQRSFKDWQRPSKKEK